MHANPNIATERGVLIHNGFGTGQDFLGFSDEGKVAYAMGTINGFLMALMPALQKHRYFASEVALSSNKWIIA
jgi:hypothetical protein